MIPKIIIDFKGTNFIETNVYENNLALFYGDKFGSFIKDFEIFY